MREGVRGTRQGIHPHLIEMVVGGGGVADREGGIEGCESFTGFAPWVYRAPGIRCGPNCGPATSGDLG